MKPVGRIFALHRGGVDKKDVAELGRDLRARPAHVHGAEKHPAERWLGVVEDVDVVAGKRRHRDAEEGGRDTVAVPKRKRWVVDLFVEKGKGNLEAKRRPVGSSRAVKVLDDHRPAPGAAVANEGVQVAK